MEEVDETDAKPQVLFLSDFVTGYFDKFYRFKSFQVGVTYYDSSTCQLNVMEFWEDGDKDFHLVDMVKYQARPCFIYTSTESEESFLAALQSSDGLTEAPTVKLVRSSLFSYEQARHRTCELLEWKKG